MTNENVGVNFDFWSLFNPLALNWNSNAWNFFETQFKFHDYLFCIFCTFYFDWMRTENAHAFDPVDVIECVPLLMAWICVPLKITIFICYQLIEPIINCLTLFLYYRPLLCFTWFDWLISVCTHTISMSLFTYSFCRYHLLHDILLRDVKSLTNLEYFPLFSIFQLNFGSTMKQSTIEVFRVFVWGIESLRSSSMCFTLNYLKKNMFFYSKPFAH